MCVPGLELLAVISTIHLLERENNIHVDLRKQNKRQEDSKTIIVLVCLVCLFVLDVCLYWMFVCIGFPLPPAREASAH